jgi:hypothetical protein
MSGSAIGLVWEEYPGGGDDFNLALALADGAGDGGYVYIETTLRLLHQARLTEARFARALTRMQAKGWLRLIDANERLYRLGPNRCTCSSKLCICFSGGNR